ncbi:hypothetical protein [[Acholeplasma] multilocale]|uniref:hypothetical protein n=1 Tax=[Acholeplasma] multilocale TaxID=264638 RepID=UPI00047DAAF7|nr:hypothetical protein [[Acholeplasma] multilocale]
MSNKFNYDKPFWELIDDEVFLIEYYPDFKYDPMSKAVGEVWRDKKTIEPFREWLSEMFTTIKPIFIGPDDVELSDGIGEMIIIRLNAFTTVLADFKELYLELLNECEGNIPMNEFGMDSLVQKTFIELAKEYMRDYKSNLEKIELVEPFMPFANEVIRDVNKALKLESREDIIEAVYMMQETLAEYIESLDDQDLDVCPQEIGMANVFLKFITYIETITYYLMLTYETLLLAEERHVGIDDYDNKLVVIEREDRIQMVEVMNKEQLKN